VSDLDIFIVVVDSTCFITCGSIPDTHGVTSQAREYSDDVEVVALCEEQRKRHETRLFNSASYPLPLLGW
jgi:hypothetical protein